MQKKPTPWFVDFTDGWLGITPVPGRIAALKGIEILGRVRFKVMLASDAFVGSRLISPCLLNQPDDALCYVSPARCAASSLILSQSASPD